MNPGYLATLVFIGSNHKGYMPPVKDIWQRYLRKFSKNGKLLEADIGLVERLPLPLLRRLLLLMLEFHSVYSSIMGAAWVLMLELHSVCARESWVLLAYLGTLES